MTLALWIFAGIVAAQIIGALAFAHFLESRYPHDASTGENA